MKNFSTTDSTAPEHQAGSALVTFCDTIQADVVFGSPREDCAGTGICRIEALGMPPAAAAGPRECRRARATLTSPDAQTLELLFCQTDLCVHLFRHYFRQNEFRLQENCPLPAFLVQTLQLASDELRAGSYPIRRQGEFYRIAVKV